MSIADAVEIVAAEAQDRQVLERLLQLYQHDLSEFAEVGEAWGDVDDLGLFRYIYLESYWTEKRRKPFLFRVGGKLAGFAFINDWSPSGQALDWNMSEFFVLRKYRGAGIGGRAARAIITGYPGVWEVGVSSYNLVALAFWRAVLARHAKHDTEEIVGAGPRWWGPILRLTPRNTPE